MENSNTSSCSEDICMDLNISKLDIDLNVDMSEILYSADIASSIIPYSIEESNVNRPDSNYEYNMNDEIKVTDNSKGINNIFVNSDCFNQISNGEEDKVYKFKQLSNFSDDYALDLKRKSKLKDMVNERYFCDDLFFSCNPYISNDFEKKDLICDSNLHEDMQLTKSLDKLNDTGTTVKHNNLPIINSLPFSEELINDDIQNKIKEKLNISYNQFPDSYPKENNHNPKSVIVVKRNDLNSVKSSSNISKEIFLKKTSNILIPKLSSKNSLENEKLLKMSQIFEERDNKELRNTLLITTNSVVNKKLNEEHKFQTDILCSTAGISSKFSEDLTNISCTKSLNCNNETSILNTSNILNHPKLENNTAKNNCIKEIRKHKYIRNKTLGDEDMSSFIEIEVQHLVAKIYISKDTDTNTINILVNSSNGEQTTFKVNDSDIISAINRIKDNHLDDIGLRKEDLIEKASINIKSNYVQNKKFNFNQNIDFYVEEVSSHILSKNKKQKARSNICKEIKIEAISNAPKKNKRKYHKRKNDNVCKGLNVNSNLDNICISVMPRDLPTMVAVPSVLDTLSGTNNSGYFSKNDNPNVSQNNTKKKDKSKLLNQTLTKLGTDPKSLKPNVDNNGVKKWMCPISSCQKYYPKLFYLKIHILNHNGARPYKCTYENCNWAFYTHGKLKNHMETHLKRKDFVCPNLHCDKRFTTVYNLNVHKRIHNKTVDYECSYCTLHFQSKSSLEKHLRTHKDIKPSFTCQTSGCKKAFLSQNLLKKHLKIHADKTLTCSWLNCGKSFLHPSRLKEHLRIHTGSKPYVCDFDGCNARFHSCGRLTRHKKRHLDDRKFICSICEKGFLRSDHLKGHLVIHTGEKNFKCTVPECGRVFTAKSTLYVHMKKHNEKSIKYACLTEGCAESFISKKGWKQHVLNCKHQSDLIEPLQYDYINFLSDRDSANGLSSTSEIKSSVALLKTINFQSNANQPMLYSTLGCINDLGINKSDCNLSTAASINLDGSNVLMMPEGLFTFENDSLPSSSELFFQDLSSRENILKSYIGTNKNDLLVNAPHRSKRKGSIGLLPRKPGSSVLSSSVVICDGILPSVEENSPLSLAFPQSILPVDGLYEDSLISELNPDPTESTINLRDLE